MLMQAFFACARSGISAFARTARPSFAAATRRAVRPASLNFRAPVFGRFASTAGVGDGKIYQVIGKLDAVGRVGEDCFALADRAVQQVPSSMVRNSAAPMSPPGVRGPPCFAADGTRSTVKFDTDKLPPILNALETNNNGHKLVLEVAVCQAVNQPTAHCANGASATSRRERRKVHCHGRLVSLAIRQAWDRVLIR